jgi:hypothetical protein
MTHQVIPYGDAGMASLQTDAFLIAPELFISSQPDPVTRSFTFNPAQFATLLAAAVAAGAADVVPNFTVVAWDSASSSVKLGLQNASLPIVGVTAAPISIDQGTTTPISVPVFTSGYFNIDALNWDASFTTAAQKLVAGDSGSEFPNSQLLFGQQKYAGIVTNPTSAFP